MDVVTHVVKFNGQTAGRDKIYRLAQYTARFLKWYWTRHGADKSLVSNCQTIENALSMTRKAMRLGKSIDMIQGAISNAKLADTVLRAFLVLNKLSQACYLLVDNWIWLAKLGLIPGADVAKISKTAARFWLLSIMAGLARDLLDIIRIVRIELRKQRQYRRSSSSGSGSGSGGGGGSGGGSTDRVVADRAAICSQTMAVASRVIANRPLVVDTVRNMADLFLPSATLGYIPSSDGWQGLMGMISSYMGILAIWDPVLKLTP